MSFLLSQMSVMKMEVHICQDNVLFFPYIARLRMHQSSFAAYIRDSFI